MKTDIRIVKTKQAVEAAFISLVESKGYREVKLVDIAQKARVNRNTIYLNYQSKEGIITSIVSNSAPTDLRDFSAEKLIKMRANRRRIENLFQGVFKIIDANSQLYKILLKEDDLIGFFNIELRKFKKAILEKIKQTTKNEIIINYFVNGLFGIVYEYVMNTKGSSEDYTKVITDLTMSIFRRIQL